MPTSAPKQNGVAGKSVHQIMSKWAAQARMRPTVQAKTLDGTEGQTESGLLGRVNRLREEMQERRIAEMAIGQTEEELAVQKAETEAKRAEAEVRSLESKSRLQEMREKLQGDTGGQQSLTLMAVLELLKEAQDRVYESRQEPSEASKMYDLMREELAEIRTDIRSRSASSQEDPLESLTKQVGLLVQIKQVLADLAPVKEDRPAYSSAKEDLETTIKVQELELAHQTRRMELEMQQERWKAEMLLRQQEINSESERSRVLGQSLGTLAETFKPVVEELAQGAIAKREAVPQSAAAFSVPPVADVPAAENGNVSNIHLLKCPNDGTEISVKYGETEAFCPKCEETLSVNWSN